MVEADEERKQIWVGIDLGTTNSCVAVYNKNEDRSTMIQITDGDTTIPSFVCFKPENNQVLSGKPAREAIIKYPDNTLYDAKRCIGRKFNDPKIQKDMNNWNFKLIDKRGKPRFQIVQEGKTKEF